MLKGALTWCELGLEETHGRVCGREGAQRGLWAGATVGYDEATQQAGLSQSEPVCPVRELPSQLRSTEVARPLKGLIYLRVIKE